MIVGKDSSDWLSLSYWSVYRGNTPNLLLVLTGFISIQSANYALPFKKKFCKQVDDGID